MNARRIQLAPGYWTEVWDQGAGDPVLLLPEAPLDLRAWDAVAGLLTSRGMRVIRCDLRGFGSAAGARRVSGYRRPAMDVVALLDHVGIMRAHVVGHGFGGQVALAVARWYPERVSFGSMVGTMVEPSPVAAGMAQRMSPVGYPDIERLVRQWLGPSASRTSCEARYVREQLRNADLRAWQHALSAMSRFDISADLKTVLVPMRLIAAADDSDVSPSHISYAAKTLPHGEFALAPGHGHMLPLVAPKLTSKLIAGIDQTPLALAA